MQWTTLDTWIVVAAVLAAVSSSLVGAFLVLKKASMMGDAISHAVLPGIAVAFIISGSRASGTLLIGAVVVGVLTAFLVEIIRHHARLEEGASMGVVFTILFALGLVLIERAAHHVDIHPDHVLFGAAELVPLYMVRVLRWHLPRGVLVLSGVTAANVLCVVLLFKELRLVTFDPGLAAAMGFYPRGVTYLLMTMVALTTVAAFEVVGSVLVVAMIIVPGATAQLLARRLLPFLLVTVLVAALAAAGGHLVAITVPPLFGFEDTNTAGAITTVLGGLFVLAFLMAPQDGLVSRGVIVLHQRMLIAMQDVLGLMLRDVERRAEDSPGVDSRQLRRMERSPFQASRTLLGPALVLLRIRGYIRAGAAGYRLTKAGHAAAGDLLRSHRLWERFFFDEGHVELHELHPAADYLEHFTDEELQDALSRQARGVTTDPRGNPIPDPSRQKL